ncbi:MULTISPECIES: flavin reductase family protein [unclassified Streptomyces]|uniref:flavin reductase family protein n=1 Tax=unclassified Streptomyces TaxID=2593676 RepID=UPI00099C72CD|nr:MULTISPECIES: flavin reductase family protein [unclassified Streptomyces]
MTIRTTHPAPPAPVHPTVRPAPGPGPAGTGPVASDDYRDAISLLPTGVSVVTAVRSGAPAGCTANAVMSLSLDPPSLLVSLTTGSRTLAAVTEAGTFAVNVLAWPDRHLAQRFATAAPHERFEGVTWSLAHGAPVLTRSALTAVCEVSEAVPLLDHTIVAGTVTWLRTEDTEPTVLYRHRQHVLRP